MIPVFVEPTFAELLKLGEIDNSPHGVLLISFDEEIGYVVVAVKILALAAVLIESMPRAKLDAAHNAKSHSVSFILGIDSITMRGVIFVVELFGNPQH